MIQKPSWLATAAVVLVLSACSEPSNENPTSTTTSSTGGSGTGGQTTGSGGAPVNTCFECAQQSCESEVSACLRVPGCQAWSECVQACAAADDGAACLSECNQTYDGMASLYEPIYECACSSCDESCTGYDACNQKCVDDVALPLLTAPPGKLSQTGYFGPTDTDGGNGPAPYLTVFEPKYVLWSDGADKTRWWYVPKCTQIDTSDMDHWRLPVGTRFWKEFRRDGVLIETRFIHRYGPGENDWLFAAYQWDSLNTDGDAIHVPAGVQNANGTQHDIPSETQCVNCHGKLIERALGFGAIQLSHSNSGQAQSTSMATLSSAGKLTVPNADGYMVPGTESESRALGYLHANCGNCHNTTGVPLGMNLRVLVGATTVTATDAYTTAVGQPVTGMFANDPLCNGCSRIAPGSPGTSAVFIRMQHRADSAQMPPLGTEIIDPSGIEQISTWILGL
jgi:hypothetical protein